MAVIIEGHTSIYQIRAESGIILLIGKVHRCTVFLKDVLKETAS